MKIFLLLFLLASCSESASSLSIQQGEFLYVIRGAYVLNDSAKQWFETHVPLFLFPSNPRIEIKDSGNFVIIDRIEFKFLFLEKNSHQWGAMNLFLIQNAIL